MDDVSRPLWQAGQMTSVLDPADLYHMGVVVPDLDVAIERLSAVGGYRWTKTVEATIPVITADGPVDIPFKMVYSIDAPHLELVQEVPGTTWTSAPRNAAHHLGYWTDDVLATGAALERAGYAFEARAGGHESPIFAYYLDPLGVRIELMGRNAFGDWAAFLAAMAR